jgi:hypothetical protein
MLVAEITLPPELVLVILAAAFGAIGTLFGLWSRERDAHNTDSLAAAAALYDQKILNERSLSTIQVREMERDQARRDADRCERGVRRLRDTTR